VVKPLDEMCHNFRQKNRTNYTLSRSPAFCSCTCCIESNRSMLKMPRLLVYTAAYSLVMRTAQHCVMGNFYSPQNGRRA